MGIAENLKENLKIKLQNNLSRDYIRKILNIIGKKPVLAAFGATFASKSDKYLNIASIKSVRRTYDGKNIVAYGSLFLPYEMFHALGLEPFMPEIMGGFTGSMGLADKTLKAASSKWYTPDLCTFHRSASGAVELGIFPVPDFIICSSLACDAAQKTFYIDAKKYGIEDNFYLVDIPYEKDELSVKYLAAQLEKISADICKKSGKKLDMEKFKKSIILSNEFRQWAQKAWGVRKELLIYPRNFSGMNFILPFHGLAGTKDAVDIFKVMYFELSELLKKQKNGRTKSRASIRSAGNSLLNGSKININRSKINSNSSNINSNNSNINSNNSSSNSDNCFNNNKSDKVKKILWLHLRPYYNNSIFELLEKNNYMVVFEEISHVYWPELDPEKPFESLAIKLLSNPLNGSVQNRVSAILKMAKDYHVDGVIMFAHWGCRHSNGGARIIKDSLKEQDIPMLMLDGDCLNKNNSSEGQILTRLQGFMEIVDARHQ